MSTVDTIAYPDEFRAEIRKRIETLLSDTSENASTNATNIEKGIFNWTIQHASKNNIVKKWSNSFFITLYIDRLRSVYINLKKPDVASAITSGKTRKSVINRSMNRTLKRLLTTSLATNASRRNARTINCKLVLRMNQ
jgi:DNA-directed RNA polymerase beta' subunit